MDLSDENTIFKDTELLRLLVASISALNDIVLITEADPIDPPGPKIVFVNVAFERLTGYTAAEVIGKNPRILQGPSTDRAELDKVRAAIAAKKPIRSEIYNYGKNGNGYWLEINMVPIINKDGVVTHFVAVERDIDERKRLEEEMKNNASELKRLNAVFVDRELKMLELKNEIKDLKKQLGA